MKARILTAVLTTSASIGVFAVAAMPPKVSAVGASMVTPGYAPARSFAQVNHQRIAQISNLAVPEQQVPADAAGQPAVAQEPVRAFGVLPNGLRYLIERRTGENVSVRLTVGIGTAAETPAENGVAHLIEHLAFNELRGWPRGAFRKAMTRQGVTLTGNTGNFDTQYGLNIPASSSVGPDQALGIVRAWADGIVINDRSVNLEKGVVIAEGNGNKTVLDHTSRLAEKLFDYGSSWRTHDNAVRAFTPEMVRAFYEKWYQPSLMTVVVVGDVNIGEWRESIEDGLSSMPKGKPIETPRDRPAKINDLGELFTLQSGDQNSRVYSSIFEPAERPTESESILGEEIRYEIARIFLENRAKSLGSAYPLLNFSFLTRRVYSRNLILESIVDDARYAERIAEQIRFIEQSRKYPMTQREFDHAKGMARRSFARGVDEPVLIARFYSSLADRLTENSRYLNRADRRKIFDAVSLPEMQTYVQGILRNKVQSAIAMPPTQTVDLPRLRQQVESLRVDPPKPNIIPGAVSGYIEPKELMSPRLGAAAVTPTQPLLLYGLPGGHSLIWARPKETPTATAFSLRAVLPRPNDSGSSTPTGVAIPVVVLPEGTSMAEWQSYAEEHQLRPNVRVSDSAIIFGIDAAPGSESAAFSLLGLAKRHPEFVKSVGASGATRQLEGNPLSYFAARPIKLIVSGFVDGAEILKLAETSLVDPKTAPRCALEGAKIDRSVRMVHEEIFQRDLMKISMRISGIQPDSVCLDLFRQVLGAMALEELRYAQAVSYTGSVGTTLEIRDGNLTLNFTIGLPNTKDKVVRRKYSLGVLSIVNALATGNIDRDQFDIEKKLLIEAKLGRSPIPPHLADELSQVLVPDSETISRYDDGFSIEQIEYSNFVGMAKSLFDGFQGEIDDSLKKYQSAR